MKGDVVSNRRHTTLKWIAACLGIAAFLAWVLHRSRGRTDRRTIQRRFWAPIYDRLANLYDAVDWFTGGTTHRLRRPALRHLPPAGSHVLEIGFGSGRLHVEMAQRHRMAGVDLAPGMARLTRRRLAARGLRSHLVTADVHALPWHDGQFDALVSTFAFSAFPDADAALDEMVRVTRPGGRVIIVDAGEAADGNFTAHLLASAWTALGDYMRDEVPLMTARGLSVAREEYGPWGCVHVVVGTRPIPIGEKASGSRRIT
jgi:ubiquinone/menaquinone biosynthesis C-methylase UbiE